MKLYELWFSKLTDSDHCDQSYVGMNIPVDAVETKIAFYSVKLNIVTLFWNFALFIFNNNYPYSKNKAGYKYG